MTTSSCERLKDQLQKVIVGQEALLDRLIIALVCGGHVLLEGPPGLAKTTAVHALAGSVHASFQRIQFTPDLMPGDLTGSEIFEPAKGTFRFQPGPLFHEIVLADEINRAPPKVQSALLEAMAEHQITVGPQTHQLPDLFMVLATQNPLENAGTYGLPEAQLDRFLFHLIMEYPTKDEEIEIVRRTRQVDDGRLDTQVEPITEPENILAIRSQLTDIHVESVIEQYVVELVGATRNIKQYIPDWGNMVNAGASPRGSISLLRAASANALLHQRDYVIPEDVIELAPDILRHRIVLDFAAQAEGITANQIIDELIQRVPAP
jgi:MoxR-like ATPase